MREKRVALEYRIDMTLIRREIQDACAIEPDVAGGWIVETGNEAQERGIPAARRPEQGTPPPFFN